MNFLVPGALGLLALLPILIVFYLLKVRRADFEVSSTLLWDRLLSDLTAHEPWQRLRYNPLLLLQLLFMLLLAFAVARPFYQGAATGAQNVVLLLDSSASMQAVDVAPTRFEVAKKNAIDVVQHLSDQTTISVLAVKARPEPLLGATTSKFDATHAIEQARPGSTTTNMRDAVIL